MNSNSTLVSLYNALTQKAQMWQNMATNGIDQLSKTIAKAKADAYQDAAATVQNYLDGTA